MSSTPKVTPSVVPFTPVQRTEAEQLNYVGQCIMYGRNPDWISFEDALHGIEVADAIVRSASEGKEIIL